MRHTLDTSAVAALDKQIFSEHDPPIILKNTEWWLAWSGDTPVGYGGLRPVATGEPYTYFTRAGVLPGFRGRGIHRTLIRVRLAWTRRRLYKGAMTYTMPDNTGSANNLIRRGFELFTPSYMWVGDRCLYFIKEF